MARSPESTLIVERHPLYADMAAIGALGGAAQVAFGGGTAETRLRLRNAYDLARARKTTCAIKRLERAARGER